MRIGWGEQTHWLQIKDGVTISHPSKHEALAQCWANDGPSSTTLAQHQPNIGPTPRVCWYPVLTSGDSHITLWWCQAGRISQVRLTPSTWLIRGLKQATTFPAQFIREKTLQSSHPRVDYLLIPGSNLCPSINLLISRFTFLDPRRSFLMAVFSLIIV